MDNTETQTTETQTTEAAAPAKTVIRPDLNRYVRAKSGNGKRTHRIDDFTARSLNGKTVEEVVAGGAKLGIDTAKWAHLNPGQQRMLVGNAIRHLLIAKKDPITEDQVSEVFGEPAAPYDAEAAAAAAQAAADEKAAKKAAKEQAAADAAEKAKAAAEAKAAALVEGAGGSPSEASGGAEPPEGKGKTHSISGKSKAGKK